MFLPALAAAVPIGLGIASLLGQQQTNATNAGIAEQATNANMAEAQRNRDFQREMSNTAYQRATADMTAAGINPMLAYKQGGASTPSGATGSAATAVMENSLASGINSGLSAARLRKDIESVDSQVALNQAAEKTQATQAALNTTNAKVAAKTAEKISAELPAVKARADVDVKRSAYDSEYMKYDQIMNRVDQGAGVLNKATDILKPGIKISPRGSGGATLPGWRP